MGFEAGTLLGNFCQLAQAEYLESSAVGEYRSIPVHETVQTTKVTDQFMSRPQKEMIGVCQDDFRPQFNQIFRSNSLYRSLGTHRHENRCLKCPVQGAYFSTAGGTLAGPGLEFEWRRLLKLACQGL